MKVRVYYCKEPDIQSVILRNNKISRQALDTVYNLVWECEFKNIVNVGKIWLKFIEEEKSPFGIALRKKRSHKKIAPGDIIQISNDFYVVHKVGASKIQVND
jgi:DNA helicase TIP49 (TBP-interacting protein)